MGSKLYSSSMKKDLSFKEPCSLIGWHLLMFLRHLGFKCPLPVVTIKKKKKKGFKFINLIKMKTKIKQICITQICVFFLSFNFFLISKKFH